MSHDPDNAFADRMRNILDIANRLKEATMILNSPGHPVSRTCQSPVVIDPIYLPNPPPLLHWLLEAGAGHEIATAASKLYQVRAEELQQQIQKSILASLDKIADFPVVAPPSSPGLLIGKVVSAATKLYLQRLGQWKEEIVQRVRQQSNSLVNTVAPRNARTFNHEYTPLLERFFEENPFPTHADKVFLAKKSNMEYRQIHVWFQNRRNRVKKEGKMLRKKPECEGVTKPLRRFSERLNGNTVGSDAQAPKFSKYSSKGAAKTGAPQRNVLKDGFVSASPPHAFPSLYPPACHYNPFPCKSGFVDFNKPEWRRVPDSKQPPPFSTSIDDLVVRFSCLSVRDEIRSKASQLQSNAATAAITVIPSRAPHPSLVVHKYCQPIITVQRRPSVRPHACHSDIFQSFGSASKPVTLVPYTVPPKNELSGRRKTVPLPRRLPGQTRNSHRDTTPSDCSSTSSSSPRMFPTDSENRSCSSSVSSLSSPSDAVGIQELPLVQDPMPPTI